jgi:hypothetical protein
LLLLEEASLQQQELRALDELKHRYLDHARATDGKGPDSEALREFLQSGGFISRPATLLPTGGYGLPQAAERQSLAGEADRRVAQWMQQGDALRTQARQWLPPARRATLEGAEGNIDLLGERLRQLHQEQGGITLQ